MISQLALSYGAFSFHRYLSSSKRRVYTPRDPATRYHVNTNMQRNTEPIRNQHRNPIRWSSNRPTAKSLKITTAVFAKKNDTNGDMKKSVEEQLADVEAHKKNTENTEETTNTALSAFLSLPLGSQATLVVGGLVFLLLLNSFGIRALVAVEGMAVSSIVALERTIVGLLVASLKYVALAGVVGLVIANVYWNVTNPKKDKK